MKGLCVCCGEQLEKDYGCIESNIDTNSRAIYTIQRETGYHICPKCRIVYKEEGE